MSNLNDFNREAKAALWVVLQWLLSAEKPGYHVSEMHPHPGY